MAQPSKASDDNDPLMGPICLAFSGAGLHGFYFNGVCQYISEQDIEVKEAWGSSAGALAALSALMKVGPEAYEAVFTNYDTNHHHVPWILWHGRDFVWEGTDGGIRRYMPQTPEAEAAWLESRINGKLHIVLTRLSGWRFERVVVNNWTSVEDLIGCIRATMTIPGITATRPFRWRGDCWIDGGFCDQHPSTDKALLVSTSLPIQPWAHSWHRHVDIFRHLPFRQAGWHGHVSGRRDQFKLGYMDAKTYFEGGVVEKSLKPLRPRARAMRFLMNLGLELVQGSFMLALTARFIWSRKALWRRLIPIPGRSSPSFSSLLDRKHLTASVVLRAFLQRLSLLLEVMGISIASLLLWFGTVDLRLDLSEHLLELAAIGLGKKRLLQSGPSSGHLAADEDSVARVMERTRRARSQPCRARRA